MTKGATIREFAVLAAALALVAASAGVTRAPAQEIMLERVGAVRLAAPGELERNDDWLQKAFRNQARVAARRADSRLLGAARGRRDAAAALRRPKLAGRIGAGAGEGNRTLV